MFLYSLPIYLLLPTRLNTSKQRTKFFNQHGADLQAVDQVASEATMPLPIQSLSDQSLLQQEMELSLFSVMTLYRC